jgi:hypothetical protein
LIGFWWRGIAKPDQRLALGQRDWFGDPAARADTNRPFT